MNELATAALAASAWSLSCLLACTAALVCAWGMPRSCVLAGRRSRRCRQGAAKIDDRNLPLVTLIIPAIDEPMVVAFRIEQALSLDYPRGKLKIIASLEGCDACVEATVRGFTHRGVRVVDAIGTGIKDLTGDVVFVYDEDRPLDRQLLLEWLAVRNATHRALDKRAGAA